MVNAGDDVRVMIIDDHEVVRRGIAEVVERADGLGVVAEAGSVQEAIRRGELVRPDVALVDLRLPDGTGIDIRSPWWVRVWRRARRGRRGPRPRGRARGRRCALRVARRL